MVERSRGRRRLFYVATPLLAILAGLLLLEGLLRLGYWIAHRARPPVARIGGEWGWRPTPDLDIRYSKEGYGEIAYSSTRDGFRVFGDPLTTKTKVFAVGDSTTQAYQVSDGMAYYDYLARHDPGLEIFALGVGGYGTTQQALAVERFAGEIDPDVVLWQFCGNDLINNDWLLESRSNENNNHMLRPYLEDDRIVLRHPDGRLGRLAQRSVLARRLAVLRSSLRKRRTAPIESELGAGHPDFQRAVEATRRSVLWAMRAAPEARFAAFLVPAPDLFPFEAEAFAEICSTPGLECIREVETALAEAERSGMTIDGGGDPHWNAAGHAVAGRAILEFLRSEDVESP